MIVPRWAPDMPVEVRGALAPHLERWLPLLPRLYEELRVEWHPGLEVSLAINTHVPNRWAVFKVGAAFLEQPEDERQVHVLHELVHAAWAEYTDLVSHLVEELTPEDSRERAVAEAALLRAGEACTEDTARGIRRLLFHSLRAPSPG